jgi:hypothetical protein
MAFKENKDSLSLDKGAADKETVEQASAAATAQIEANAELIDELDNYAVSSINSLNSQVSSQNSILFNKADVGPITRTVLPAQIDKITKSLTKTVGLSIGSNSSSTSSNSYSFDGINWSSPNTTPSTSAPWSNGAYGDGKFVLIAGQANSTSHTSGQTTVGAYSTNGITWTLSTMPGVSQRWSAIAYGADKFVAAASNNTAPAYSTNGITWTQLTLPNQSWAQIAYGAGRFVAMVGISSQSVAPTSTDGITWTLATTHPAMPSAAPWQRVTYGGDRFVAITSGTNNNKAAYSTDGLTWAASTLPASIPWSSVTYGAGRFVATAGTPNDFYQVMAHSTDGITWTQGSMPQSARWSDVAFVNDRFIAVAYNAGTTAYSTNGITWTIGGTTTQSNSQNRQIVVGNATGPMVVDVASEDYVNAAIAAAIAAL